MPSTYKALGSILSIRVGMGMERGFTYVLFVPVILVLGGGGKKNKFKASFNYLSQAIGEPVSRKPNQTMNTQKEGKVKILEGSVGPSDHFTVSYVHLTCLGSLGSLTPRLFKTGQVWLSCRDELVPFLEFWL